jgi:hypothetical protein
VLILAAALALLAPASADARTWTPAQIKQVIRHQFGARGGKAIAVARCETGGTFDNHAIGSAGERSIFQIHPVHFDWANPRRLYADPVYATRIAYRLSRAGTDWSAWSCG